VIAEVVSKSRIYMGEQRAPAVRGAHERSAPRSVDPAAARRRAIGLHVREDPGALDVQAVVYWSGSSRH
jgi:hypothetical protein